MKYFYFLLIFSFTLSCQAQFARKIKISGSVYFQNLYCGGIQPNSEQIKKADTKYAFCNSTFKLVQLHDSTKIFFVKSNNEGKVYTKIPKGKYRYYMTEEYDKLLKIRFNPKCSKWLNAPFGTIEISKKNKMNTEIVFKFGCSPCEPPRQ